jgi:hypothetical protein
MQDEHKKMLFIIESRSKKLNSVASQNFSISYVRHTHSGSPYPLNSSEITNNGWASTDLYPIETVNVRLATKLDRKKPQETKQFYIMQYSLCFDQHKIL